MKNTIRLFILLLAIFCSRQAAATGDSLNYLLPEDTIYLSINAFSEKIFEHQVAPKQTLYSLAKFYGLPLDELYFYNPQLRMRALSVGEGVRIPIPNRAILRYWSFGFDPGRYVPVCYVVKKGDTMFRISKYYFKMPIEDILQRNGLPGIDLNVGQVLHMGWMAIEGVPENFRLISGGPLVKQNLENRSRFIGYSTKSPRSRKGVAAWDNESKDSPMGQFFAMHRTAPLYSIIAVTNPWMKRTVYAKVMGRIPSRLYGKEVEVVLSVSGARFLGAIDEKFFVEVKHF